MFNSSSDTETEEDAVMSRCFSNQVDGWIQRLQRQEAGHELCAALPGEELGLNCGCGPKGRRHKLLDHTHKHPCQTETFCSKGFFLNVEVKNKPGVVLPERQTRWWGRAAEVCGRDTCVKTDAESCWRRSRDESEQLSWFCETQDTSCPPCSNSDCRRRWRVTIHPSITQLGSSSVNYQSLISRPMCLQGALQLSKIDKVLL